MKYLSFILVGYPRIEKLKLDRSSTPTNIDISALPYTNIAITSPLSWSLKEFADNRYKDETETSVTDISQISLMDQTDCETDRKEMPPLTAIRIGHHRTRQHKSHHKSSKLWTCEKCQRAYKWKNSLICHIKNECGQPPKYFCTRKCGYKTNILSNMKRHLNSKCKPK